MLDAPGSAARQDRGSRRWGEGTTLARWRAHAPHLVLATSVAGAFVAYALLAHAAPAPRVFLDELIYMDAASSLADGRGLQVREEPYGFAMLYPIVLAPLLLAFERDTAYEVAKLLNALLFALAAIPVYLLAGRLLAPWQSAAVAALSIAIPSAMYTSVVMTESLAYLLSCVALLAIVLALERPTVLRQVAALTMIAIAILTRPQFLALYVALLVSLVAVPYLLERRPKALEVLRRAWPTLGAGVIGAGAILVRPLVRGGDALGAYSVLWRPYSPADVARYVVYEIANLGLYLAIVPLAVAPVVVVALMRRARNGDIATAAFAVLFVTVNVALITLVAAFDSYHVLYLHDRYLFYVVPLWLVVLFVWATTCERRPVAAVGAGLGLAMLVSLTPLSELERFRGHWRFHALGSAFPTEIADAVGSTGAARLLLAAVAVLLAGATFALRARAMPIVVTALAATFALNATGAWATALDPLQRSVFPSGTEDKRWVDNAVPAGTAVLLLYVSCEHTVSVERWQVTTNSILLSEFFNSSIGRVAHVGGPDESTAFRVESGGALTFARSRRPLHADYVVAQPGVRVQGRRLASGTAEQLVLWRVDGDLRLAGTTSTSELSTRVCRAAARSGI